MESVAISFLHDGSYRCGFLIVWLVGRIWISLVHTVLIRTSHEVFFYCPPVATRNWEDIVHKAMVLLDIHFTVAYPANFVLWRWLSLSSAFRRSVCEIDIVGVERGCGNMPCGCALHNTMQQVDIWKVWHC